MDVGPEWQYESVVKGISVAGDTVYAAVTQWRAENGYISSGWIVALDKHTGEILWRFSSGSGNEQRSVNSAPTVAGRLLLASDIRGNSFFAVDRFTGKEVWRYTGAPGRFGPSESPEVVEGIGYVASNDQYVYAFEPEAGRILWKTQMPASMGSFAVCKDRIFVNYQYLGVLDRRTGKILARAYEDTSELFTSDFAVHEDRVFIVGDKYIYAFKCE